MNSKLTAILVDDESPCIEALSWDLKTYCPDVQVLATATNPAKAIELIEQLQPEVVFLDIEMPEMSGFEVVQKIKDQHCNIIFVTAFDQFAIKAFKVAALDYLLKPVNKDELIAAVTKASQPDREISKLKLDTLISNIKTEGAQFKKIVLPTLEGLEFIETKQIIRCESSSNYTLIHLQNGANFVASKTLKVIEEMLQGHHFFRVHNSHLANLDHVKSYLRGEGGELIMCDNSRIPVSKRKKESLLTYIAKTQE